MEEFVGYLRNTLEANDEIYFNYIDDESVDTYRVLKIPENETQKIRLEKESNGQQFEVGYKILKDYFKNPATAAKEYDGFEIEIQPSFDFLGIDPSTERDDPLEEQLVNKLKPVIKEMMRGNYG